MVKLNLIRDDETRFWNTGNNQVTAVSRLLSNGSTYVKLQVNGHTSGCCKPYYTVSKVKPVIHYQEN